MRQHLDSSPTSLETGSHELAGDPPAAVEMSPGVALNQAQTVDREWRRARRSQAATWIRKTSRLGLMAQSAARVAFFGGLLIGIVGVLASLAYWPLGMLILGAALGAILLSPFLFLVAWLLYIALGAYSRWAKHEAILDDLPSRRPLLWPGTPRPK